MRKRKPNIFLQILFFIMCFILGWTVIIPLIVSGIAYEVIFNSRVEKTRKIQSSKDYPNMIEKTMKFNSRSNVLAGSLYYDKDLYSKKALVVVSHGIGCGKNNYLNRVNYFIKKGYLVFAYDIGGCCESTGKSIKGLPEAIVDLKSAILFAESLEESKGLKTLVYGHSWSGYASACVLNDDKICKDVTAVASMSGFNDSWKIIEKQGTNYVGNLIKLIKPATYMYQMLKFGKCAFYKGINGINKFNKPVFITHSKDDPTVRFDISIAAEKDKCSNDRAVFEIYEDRGHTTSRPLEDEKAIVKSLKGTPEPPARGSVNIFQYNVDIHYDYVENDKIFSIDESFMDKVNNFFEKALIEG